jgi:hypothetical protein
MRSLASRAISSEGKERRFLVLHELLQVVAMIA